MQLIVNHTVQLSPRTRGLNGMIASSVMFSLMSVLIRYAPDIGSYRMAMVRFAVGIALLASLAMAGKVQLTFKNKGLLLFRGILGGIGVVLHYYAIIHIGLAKGTVITYLYPVFAAIFGAIFLKESVPVGKILAIGLALVGLCLTVCDGWNVLQGWDVHELIALVGAIIAGIVVVMIRKLCESDSAPSIFCAQCVMGFWIVIIPANHHAGELSLEHAVILVGIGLLAACGQLLMTHSFKHVAAGEGSMLSMLCPLLNVLLGMLLFREAISLINGLGMAMVLFACCRIASRR